MPHIQNYLVKFNGIYTQIYIRLRITRFDLFSVHILLSDIQIKRARPQDKPYTLDYGAGLSLLVDVNGA